MEDSPDSGGLVSSGTNLPRMLTDWEQDKLRKDCAVLSEFKQNKLETEACKNWDKFYKRNTTKFFKDRHWTRREFEELCGNNPMTSEDHCVTLLEVGCGVGNFLFPLLEGDSNMFIYACDFSPRAVDFVKENPLYDSSRCKAFVCDVVNTPLSDHIPRDTVDIATLIFVLSAIHPDKMEEALRNIFQVLKPGGVLLFRDYGLYDHAMMRFAPGHKLGENFYVRQDGTRAYYFSTDLLQKLASCSGFETTAVDYVKRETVNKKEDMCVPRIFVQAKFRKPDTLDCAAHKTESVKCAAEETESLKCESLKCASNRKESEQCASRQTESAQCAPEKTESVQCVTEKTESVQCASTQKESVQCESRQTESVQCAIEKTESVEGATKKTEPVQCATEKTEFLKCESVKCASRQTESVQCATEKTESWSGTSESPEAVGALTGKLKGGCCETTSDLLQSAPS